MNDYMFPIVDSFSTTSPRTFLPPAFTDNQPFKLPIGPPVYPPNISPVLTDHCLDPEISPFQNNNEVVSQVQQKCPTTYHELRQSRKRVSSDSFSCPIEKMARSLELVPLPNPLIRKMTCLNGSLISKEAMELISNIAVKKSIPYSPQSVPLQSTSSLPTYIWNLKPKYGIVPSNKKTKRSKKHKGNCRQEPPNAMTNDVHQLSHFSL